MECYQRKYTKIFFHFPVNLKYYLYFATFFYQISIKNVFYNFIEMIYRNVNQLNIDLITVDLLFLKLRLFIEKNKNKEYE